MSIDSVVDHFFNVLNSNGAAGYHSPAELINNVFAGDSGAGANQTPVVGITEHGRAAGPRFVGTGQISNLFGQLFTSFPDVALTPLAGAPRLYSNAKDTVAVQADFEGTYASQWFRKPDPFHSLPLSGLNPVVDPNTGKYKTVHIPAVAVFTFANDRVTQLAVYMDRYKFSTAITSLHPSTFERDMTSFLHKSSEARK